MSSEAIADRSPLHPAESDERHAKRERVRGFLKEHHLDGVLLTRQENVSWYTDGARTFINTTAEESIAYILVTMTEEHLFCNSAELSRLNHEEFPRRVEHEHLYSWWEDMRPANILKTFAGSRIETDTGSFTKKFAQLRYSLLPDEIERYRSLGADTAAVLTDAIGTIQPGMTEYDLAGEITLRFLRRGIYPLVLMVAFDDRAHRYRHPLPTGNRLKRVALVTACARRSGLIASATRQIVLGEVSGQLRSHHRSVSTLDAWLMAQTNPRRKVSEIFRGLQKEYARLGFEHHWKLHHQGGATGYAVRDYRASDESAEVVHAAQAFAWNPTISGTKSEDTILTSDNGIEILTVDRRWPMIEIELQGRVYPRPDILILD